MTEHTPKQIARAERIADVAIPLNERIAMYNGALAAIVEVSELAAKIIEAEIVDIYDDSPDTDAENNRMFRRLAKRVRTGIQP